jgi:hypothetical protein
MSSGRAGWPDVRRRGSDGGGPRGVDLARSQDKLNEGPLPASPEQEAMLNLARTSDAFALALARLLRRHRLSPPQYDVPRILRGAGGRGLPCLRSPAGWPRASPTSPA